MPKLEQAVLSELVDQGVTAFKTKDFPNALKHLQLVLDNDPRHWRAKLYLAMSYYHTNEIFTAYRHFSFLRDNCTDAEIRGKAESAMAAMNSQLQGQSNKMLEMTCTMKKPGVAPPPPASKEDEADCDLEWVDEKQLR